MNFIYYLLFITFIGLVGILPFQIIYGISNFAAIFLRKIIGYRTKVITKNLNIAFPDLSIERKKSITRKIYKNITDNLLESLKSFSMSKKNIVKRHKIINPEFLDQYLKQKQSIIGVTAHYGNWEWGSMSASLQTDYKCAALYKPLHNKLLDKVLKNSRSKCGTELVSIFETSEAFERNKNIPTIYLMAADQSPSKRQLKHSIWVDFFGMETPFLHGVEKHARKNNYPVIFIDIQRVKRGFYEIELSTLTDKPNDLAPGDITRLYAEKLEKVIQKKPEDWLWSHNRWKHNKTI